MRFLLTICALVAAAISLADDCKACGSKAEACLTGPTKDRTSTLHWDKALQGEADLREQAFWATAKAMLLSSENGMKPVQMISFGPKVDVSVLDVKTSGECDRSTAEKPIAKGAKGCCNAPGAPAQFKVWAGGRYHFFGCEDSAKMGAEELNRKGLVAGSIQPVSTKGSAVN